MTRTYRFKIVAAVTALATIAAIARNASARETHVAKTGDDRNRGSLEIPFLTIGQAPAVGLPGDPVTVHGGTGREWVKPPRGGKNEDSRIVYRSAKSLARSPDQPNILWITSEDNSPYVGCYGDPLAHTPNLDRLAAEGVRYRHAFANAPVCSAARTTLITGMYASSLGVQHHRSRVRIPETFPLYPVCLREAGYYCTNNSKTDYNLANAGQPWDESSPKAHYKHRRTGQPFFAVFNLTTSHESQVAPQAGKDPGAYRVPPERIVLPPYHPDTPEIRLDWANYYDQMTRLDEQVGRLLADLEKAGLAGETIVFYYSDHGGALPRGKRNLHDSGTRVPLVIRFPARWAHLAPAPPGAWVDRLVSFVDFPATLLSLGGAAIPDNYEGRAFLGEQVTAPREHVFLYRGRMDERNDTARAIRDRQFRYIRNYSPHRPWGQHYAYPFQVLPSMRSWHASFAAGRCNPVQARYWGPKPPEELYDVAADPFEIRNLADDPRQAARLAARHRLHSRGHVRPPGRREDDLRVRPVRRLPDRADRGPRGQGIFARRGRAAGTGGRDG